MLVFTVRVLLVLVVLVPVRVLPLKVSKLDVPDLSQRQQVCVRCVAGTSTSGGVKREEINSTRASKQHMSGQELPITQRRKSFRGLRRDLRVKEITRLCLEPCHMSCTLEEQRKKKRGGSGAHTKPTTISHTAAHKRAQDYLQATVYCSIRLQGGCIYAFNSKQARASSHHCVINSVVLCAFDAGIQGG